MSDPEIAAILRDYCSRRLNTIEHLTCCFVADGKQLHPRDVETFEKLKAEFSDEIQAHKSKP